MLSANDSKWAKRLQCIRRVSWSSKTSTDYCSIKILCTAHELNLSVLSLVIQSYCMHVNNTVLSLLFCVNFNSISLCDGLVYQSYHIIVMVLTLYVYCIALLYFKFGILSCSLQFVLEIWLSVWNTVRLRNLRKSHFHLRNKLDYGTTH